MASSAEAVAAGHCNPEGRGRGCPILWLLSFGQAKESDLPPGNPRPYHPHAPCGLGRFNKGFRYGSAVQTVDRLFHFPGHLLVLHYLQDFMLQEHAVQTGLGEHVLEFDSGGEHV